MRVEDQIEQSRRARTRRGRTFTGCVILGVPAYLVTIMLLPDGSPLSGVAAIALATLFTVGQTVRDGADAWQRQQRVQGFAVGAGVGVAWLIVQAIWTSVEPAHLSAPGVTLNITAASWILYDLGTRVRNQPSPEKP